MILEVLDARTGEVRTRVRIRLDALPLALGRGFGNDLILDDPYVDAQHARITADESGTLVVEDLGSVNGVAVLDGPQRAPRLPITPGMIVRVGRTTLRFRDPDEPVPGALPDVPDPVQRAPVARRWLGTKWARLGLPAVAVGCMAAHTWLHSFERSSVSETYMGVLAFLMFGVLWAGSWSAASRIVLHRFNFMDHVSVAALASLTALTFTVIGEWAEFLSPDNGLFGPLATIGSLSLIAALVATHLVFASELTTRSRWRAGAIVSGVLLALVGIAELANNESFSDVPQFSGVLKPVRSQWIPAGSVESFGATATDLKELVDGLAVER